MSEEDIAAKYSAAQSKFYSVDPAERASSLEVFKEIARDATHQEYQWWALGQLWEYSKYKLEETGEHTFVRPFLKIIATTDEHPNHCQALCMLHNSINADDIAFANPRLKKIATTDEDPDQYEALCTLRSSLDADDITFASDQLKRIAAINKHRHQGNAIALLCDYRHSDHHEFARVIARQLGDLDDMDDYQRLSIILRLRESNDPKDQALGLAWKLKYFLVAMSEGLKAKIASFNQQRFKDLAPKALEDIPEFEAQTLPARFADLMSAIETEDESSPHYLHYSVIIDERSLGENNGAAFVILKRGVQGYLKALTGQDLEKDETSMWQPHEDEKQAFIISYKHAVTELDKIGDQAMRNYALAQVVKGMLHCPTGQAEGNNSVLNALVYGKILTGGAFEEKVGAVLHQAMNAAFLNTFGLDGEVHEKSRARMVLHPHIGLSQIVQGFKERISWVADQEIPGILEDFYARFTPEFLTQYVLNHMETHEDWMASANAPSSSSSSSADTEVIRRRLQQERPLCAMDLSEWLTKNRHNAFIGFGLEYDEHAEIGHEIKVKHTMATVRRLLEVMGFFNITEPVPFAPVTSSSSSSSSSSAAASSVPVTDD